MIQSFQGGDALNYRDAMAQCERYIFAEWFDASEYAFDERGESIEFYHGEAKKLYVPVRAKA